MNTLALSRLKFVPLHLVFWCAVWLFFIYFFSYNSSDSVYVSWFSSFLLPVTIATTYFTIYYLIPKYLYTKKYKLFVLYGIYTVVVSTYLILLTIFGSFMFLSNLLVANTPPMSRNFVFVLVLVYLIVGFVSFVKLLRHNFETVAKNKQLENENLENSLKIKEQELQYLKKQIHPHFLFNTLNTIYSFALRKSERTPEIILKLSNLLDYILYQVQKPLVPLSEEVAHLQEYVSLEKIRFQDTLDVSITTEGIESEIDIPPMLFIPFVENAFKHGAIVNGFLRVNIKIGIEDGDLVCTVTNSIKEDMSEAPSMGLGLSNIERRLKLLYKNRYYLDISKNQDLFSSQLTIKNILILHETNI